jgi:hypothetical protein
MASQLNLSGVPGINFSCDVINEQIADNQDLAEETFVLENVVNTAPVRTMLLSLNLAYSSRK